MAKGGGGKFAKIVENLADGIVVLNEEEGIHFANPAACRLFGRSEEELLGVDFGIPLVNGERTEVDIPRKDGAIATVELQVELVEWDGDDMRLVSLRDVSERNEVQESLKQIEWMLSKSFRSSAEAQQDDQGYGDLTELNRDGLILNSVGREMLADITSDFLDLLGTSSAVYEANGDYAYGIFSSGWCRLLDHASRQLCDTPDNAEALASGRWICHESCWNECAKEAMIRGEAVDVECPGGIRLYGIPIYANGKVVGAIDFGYGSPPRDPDKLKELARTYNVSYEELRRVAQDYKTRPPYIIEMAKSRLRTSAHTIGLLVERKQAAEKIAESRERAQSTLDSLNANICVLDDEGTIVSVNNLWREFGKANGADPAQTDEGTNYLAVCESARGEERKTALEFAEGIREVMKGERNAYECEYPCHSPDEKRWFVGSVTPITNSEKEFTRVVVAHKNVTDRKQAEKALRRNEAKFRDYIQHAPLGLFVADEQARFVQVNPAASTITGYSEEELLSMSIPDITPPDALGEVQAQFQRMRHAGHFSGDLPFLRKSGERRYWQVDAVHISSGRNLGFAQDITDRKRMEENLRYELEFENVASDISARFIGQSSSQFSENMQYGLRRLGQFFNSDRSYIFLFSDDGQKIKYAYEWCREGIDPFIQEADIFAMQDMPWFAQLIRGEEEVHVLDIDQLPEEAKAEKKEFQRQGIKSLVFSPIIKDDCVAGLVGLDYVTEKTDLRAERLSRLKFVADIFASVIGHREAELESREKSLFLSNMSHEIRTPMNAVLGFSQILERDPSLSPKAKEQVHSIRQSGKHLLQLINGILDLSKIEAGMTELNPTVFSLHELLDDVEMMFRYRAGGRGLPLALERDENLPCNVYGDEGKLRQIFVNLISNAVKFTDEGSVSVRVSAESARAREATEAEGERVRLVCEVEDTGPGISEEDMKHIFESFEQGKSGAKFGGTGLGLSITRAFVGMMGGKLSVESEVGEGSCFRFDVILTLTEEEPEERETKSRHIVGLKADAGTPRVLIADDLESNRELLNSLLRPLGFETREAENGREALEVVRDWAPHAVLMDMRMPVMDGYEATRRIKDDENFEDIPVIVISGGVFEEERRKVLSAGASTFLAKPIQIKKLYKALAECLGLEYEYANDPKEPEDHTKVPVLTAESLEELPEELIGNMREAVGEGDIARLKELIGKVREVDKGAARGLRALADTFDYAKLEEILGGE